jgi:formylglycine-generating enzyme required for sulfatase activity
VDDDDSAAGPTVSIQQGIAFVLIPAGTFEMGCTTSQGGCGAHAYPAHTVTLTHDFWMTQTEVTQAQYLAVMGLDPSLGTCGDDCPAQYLRWSHGPMFANVLSVAEGLTPCYLCSSFEFGTCAPTVDPYLCDGYRLPTEAEWEYAARGGVDQGYPGGWLDDVAWYNANSGLVLHAVALKDPNAYGVYDMAGNVSEWVQDFYAADYYSVSPTVDPGGPATGNWRVWRSGSWDSSYSAVKVSSRLYQVPTSRLRTIGFRVVRRLP